MLNYSQNGDCKYIPPEIQRYIIRHNYGGGGQDYTVVVDLPGLLKRHCERKRKFPQNDKKKTILRERTYDFFLAEPMTCHV